MQSTHNQQTNNTNTGSTNVSSNASTSTAPQNHQHTSPSNLKNVNNNSSNTNNPNSQTISNFLRMSGLANNHNTNANSTELNHVSLLANNDLTVSNGSINLSMMSTNVNQNMSQNMNVVNGVNANAVPNTSLLDLIMCKLVAPYHVINDPRMLECGASACFRCVQACKDSERNLKCAYCGGVHKVPVDSNKLVVNKGLQNFIKTNLRQMNDNFSKQLEDSMFALERKRELQ